MQFSRPKNFINITRAYLKASIGENTAACAISGGVDSSSVAALLLSSGIKTIPVHIDTGFLREKETEKICQCLKKSGIKNIRILDQKQQFFQSLSGKKTAEEKRLAFRKTYFEVLAKYLISKNILFLCQGTKSRQAKNSRLYHNYPPADFSRLNIKMIEPLIGLSKKQVRTLAEKLRLPPEVINRKSFPGPGLLIRFGGEFQMDKLDIIKSATHIIDRLVKNHQRYFRNCFQIFPYLDDGSPTVRISNNGIKTGNLILIRAVREKGLVYLPFNMNRNIQKEMVNRLMSLPGVSRVCFDITPKYGHYNHLIAGAPIEFQ